MKTHIGLLLIPALAAIAPAFADRAGDAARYAHLCDDPEAERQRSSHFLGRSRGRNPLKRALCVHFATSP